MEIAIATLVIINIIQAVDKYLTTQKLLKQVEDAVKASMSKNLNEYMVATNKVQETTPKSEPEEVLLSEADEQTFDKFIKTQ